MTSPPLTEIYNALSAIRDDDLRHDALLAAAAEWERHPDEPIGRIAYRGWRTAKRDLGRLTGRLSTPVVSSAAVALTECRQPRVSTDDWLDWQERRQGLTARQRSICDLRLAGYTQAEIARQLDCAVGLVCQEISTAVS